jgi:hypothetical protein
MCYPVHISMITKFIFKIRKMNSLGVGFIGIPKKHRHNFAVNDYVKVDTSQIIFYAKIVKHGYLGLYIPAKFANKHKLHNKKAQIFLQKVEGFFSKIGGDGRVYLPNQLGFDFKLSHNEILELCVEIGSKKYCRYCLVKIRKKPKTTEYMCMFDSTFAKKEGIFQLKKIVSRNTVNITDNWKNILRKFNYAKISTDKLIVYYGNRVPIQIDTSINILNNAYYIGCYFSDGTKKGNSWGIVASTFDQANYFIKKHKELIKNSNIVFELSYSVYKNDANIKIKVINIWKEKTGVELSKNKIRIREIEKSPNSKRNRFGSLVMKEHKQLSLFYYNRLLEFLFNKIIEQENQELALDFILGCFEGDGSVSSKTHSHIVLTTNKQEYKILKKLSEISQIKHKFHKETNPDKYYIRYSSLSLLSNLLRLKDKLFQYYTKRRNIFIERFLKTGSVRFIMGKQDSTSGWVKKYLFDNNILDKTYKLTKKGINIKKALLELENENIK